MCTGTMENSWKIIALIPARCGSKGIPGKNLSHLGGIPLIAHAIQNARGAQCIRRIVVSTDTREIASAAETFGAEVPFLRPVELARDESRMLDVVIHAYRTLLLQGPGAKPAAIALLQPTSPFLRSEIIDRAVGMFRASDASLLQAVRRVRDHSAWMLVRRGGKLEPFLESPPPRRQDLVGLFIPCGALYLYRAEYLESPGEPVPSAWIELDWPETLDIDEPQDLQLAEWILQSNAAGPRREL